MNKFFLTMAVLFLFATTNAQQKQHKIIFDYAKGDTASFALMIRQATNIMKAAGNSLVEIVCHGPGLNIVMKERTTVQAEIQELQKKFNVAFVGCESSMQRLGIAKSQLLPAVTTVPVASLEFSSKQQEGWSYIKAGQ